jgi:hypothetical protein
MDSCPVAAIGSLARQIGRRTRRIHKMLHQTTSLATSSVEVIMWGGDSVSNRKTAGRIAACTVVHPEGLSKPYWPGSPSWVLRRCNRLPGRGRMAESTQPIASREHPRTRRSEDAGPAQVGHLPQRRSLLLDSPRGTGRPGPFHLSDNLTATGVSDARRGRIGWSPLSSFGHATQTKDASAAILKRILHREATRVTPPDGVDLG